MHDIFFWLLRSPTACIPSRCCCCCCGSSLVSTPSTFFVCDKAGVLAAPATKQDPPRYRISGARTFPSSSLFKRRLPRSSAEETNTENQVMSVRVRARHRANTRSIIASGVCRQGILEAKIPPPTTEMPSFIWLRRISLPCALGVSALSWLFWHLSGVRGVPAMDQNNITWD